jgi:pimeloyl-ACP methyl ester carboxylesterase
VRLRLHHHTDGTRIAYREEGSGTPLILLHSLGLSHREWAPIVPLLSDRYRLILPDLPLHGDSEDRPAHPYDRDWMTAVIADFCRSVGGERAIVGGHGIGADLALRSVTTGQLSPAQLVLCSTRLHGRPPRRAVLGAWRSAAKASTVPGIDRLLARGIKAGAGPFLSRRLTVTGNPEASDLLRHAFSDIGDPGRARAWSRFAANWPKGPDRELLDSYGAIQCPVLLLWSDSDPDHPMAAATEALDLLPNAQLRVLERTGYLPAYDDPVGLAREIAAFAR